MTHTKNKYADNSGRTKEFIHRSYRITTIIQSLAIVLCVWLIPIHRSYSIDDQTIEQSGRNYFSTHTPNFSGPTMTTEVAAIVLLGSSKREKVEINDFDTVVEKKKIRLIPLFRLLAALEAKGKIESAIIEFSVEGNEVIQVDTNSGLVKKSGRSFSLPVKKGVSDVTGKSEIYISDRLFKDVLGVNVVWSEKNYAYQGQTDKPLRVFVNQRKKSLKQQFTITQVAANLPETEPPQTPSSSRRFLSFIETGTQVDRRSGAMQTQTIVTPDVSLYGQLFGGNYYVRFTESFDAEHEDAPKAELWLDKALWTAKSDNFAIRAGDTSQGLGALVNPSASFTGVVARGLVGTSNKRVSNYFLSNSQFAFLSETNFDGYALIGSTVEYYVNNRLVDTQIVDDSKGAPPGQGRYSFVGVGLFGRAMNEVKIIVKEPDGTTRETQQTVVGAPNLLPSGQMAFSLGAGTRRREVNRELTTEGSYGGIGVYYGLTDNLTFGVTGARQEQFFTSTDFPGERLPQRYYYGTSLSYRWHDNFIFTGDLAQNLQTEDNFTPSARDLSASYYHRYGNLALYGFSYDSGYSHGNINIGGRNGGGLYQQWSAANMLRFQSTLATVTTSDKLENQIYLIGLAQVPALIPRTTLTWRADLLDKTLTYRDLLRNTEYDSTTRNRMYSARFESDPFRWLSLQADYVWGDQIYPAGENQLWYGISLPLVGSTPSYGTRFQTKLYPGFNTNIETTYRDNMSGLRTVDLNLSRLTRRKFIPGFALRGRYDLKRDFYTGRIDLELPFDNRRRRVIGGGVEFSQLTNDYTFNVFINFRELFFQEHGRIGRVDPDWRIQPENGGVKGFVYLDANANGHYDPDEPGVPDIEVIADGRHKAVSASNGYFLLNRRDDQDEVIVSLNDKDLPAIYTPTQGVQRAIWDEYVFTRVNLGVSVLSAVTGKVAIWNGDVIQRGLPGAIVLLRKRSDSSVVKRSITDQSGQYYLGEVIPGDYFVEVDETTVPPLYRITTEKMPIQVRAGLQPQDKDGIDFKVVAKHDQAKAETSESLPVVQ